MVQPLARPRNRSFVHRHPPMEFNMPARLLGSRHRAFVSIVATIAFAFDLPTEMAKLNGQTPSQTDTKTVYVIANAATIQSGPGGDYYPTAKAEKGMSFEVHHRTEDGWLGIRPPKGSFSWVQAKDAYLLAGGKSVEITDPNAVSWIGSQLGSAKRYRWQIKLNVGEELRVLDESTISDADGNRALWYKIAPPSGEFRWIHEEYVSTDPNGQPAAPARPKPQPTADDTVQPASGTRSILESSTTDSPDVQSANYQEDVFAEEVYSQELPPETIIEPMEYAVEAPVSSDPFAGWHALDFLDDGLHFSFIERMLGKRGPIDDPLEYDPFSLEMAKPVGGSRPSRVPAGVVPMRTTGAPGPMSSGPAYQPPQPLGRSRPWRDPRTLRQNRAVDSSYTQSESPQYLMQDIRQNVNQLRGLLGSRQGNSQLGPESRSALESAPATAASGSNGAAGPKQIDWYGVKDRESGATNSARAPANDDLSRLQQSMPTFATSNRELEQLQLALSEMVTRSPATWNLDPLKERAKHFIEHGSDPVQRGQARLLMDRIDEFQQHARRTAFVPGLNTRAAYSPSTTPGAVATAAYQPSTIGSPVSLASAARPASSTASSGKTFDATGWLVPVHGATKNQPAYALSNRDGTVIAYVSPLPGMNLDSYINKAIGISGRRGYLPQLQAGHIQAETIVEV